MVSISVCFPHSLHIRQMLSSWISLKLFSPGVLGHHCTLKCHLADNLPPCPDLFCGFGGEGEEEEVKGRREEEGRVDEVRWENSSEARWLRSRPAGRLRQGGGDCRQRKTIEEIKRRKKQGKLGSTRTSEWVGGRFCRETVYLLFWRQCHPGTDALL